MADSKVSALTLATPVATDNLYLVDDPGGTPLSKKATVDGVNTLVGAKTLTFTNKTLDADGTGNVITNIGASEVKADIITGQTDLTAVAGTDELLLSDAGTLKKIDAADAAVAIPYIIPITMMVPDGTSAYPDIHTLATAGTKVSGFTLVTGADGKIDAKCAFPLPDTLPSSPVYTVRVSLLPTTAQTSTSVSLALSYIAIADAESYDTAFETAVTATPTISATAEVIDVTDFTLAGTIAAGDFLHFQLLRDVSGDTYAGSVLVFNMALIITGS